MFEGWASDLLASYLGQFLEVQREQLRISLWSGKRALQYCHKSSTALVWGDTD